MLNNPDIVGPLQHVRVAFVAILIGLLVTLAWFYSYPYQPEPDYRDISVELLFSLVTLIVYSMVWGLGLRILQIGGGLFLLGIYMDALDDIFLAPDYMDIFICQGLQLVGVALFAWSTWYYHSQLIRKMSWLREDLAQMKFRATHDPLTNLPNRVLFQDRLFQALAGAQRRKQQLALLYIDLDNMKEVNDTLGHAMGDNLLKEVAQNLRASIRDSDTISRLGGDEFVVIQTDVHNEDDAINMATKLLAAIDKPVTCDGETVKPSASVGISLYPSHATNSDELLAKADAAMYQAKRMADKPRIVIGETDRG